MPTHKVVFTIRAFNDETNKCELIRICCDAWVKYTNCYQLFVKKEVICYIPCELIIDIHGEKN